MNKQKTLAKAFETGETFTAKQIKEQFNIKNPGEAVRQLRMKGYCIYTNPNGYRLGTPTKKMVAALNTLFGGSVFVKV